MGQKVSCRYETQWGHAALSFRAERSGVEKSPGKQFPVGKKHSGVMSSRKLYAKSFLSIRNSIGVTFNRKLYANSFLLARTTVVSCRAGNYLQTVSCR